MVNRGLPTDFLAKNDAITKLVKSAQDHGIDTSVLLNDLIDCFGGPQHLAAAMYLEFKQATPGSMVRTRTLEMIQRLVMANTQYELTQLKKPGDLNDEELEQEAIRLLQKKELTEHGPQKNPASG